MNSFRKILILGLLALLPAIPAAASDDDDDDNGSRPGTFKFDERSS